MTINDRYEFYEKGFELCLEREWVDPPTPSEQIQIVRALFEDFAPILQPISLDLRVGWTHLDGVPDHSNTFKRLYWQLCQDPPPPDFFIDGMSRPDVLVARTPFLDPETIAAWLREPLEHRVPERHTIIETLDMRDSRVRLCTPDLAANPIFEIPDGRDRYEIPVESRTDGKWVSGPYGNMSESPISLSLFSGYGMLYCNFEPTWTRWATAGTAEYDAFCSCVKKILASGWSIRYRDDVFKEGIG